MTEQPAETGSEGFAVARRAELEAIRTPEEAVRGALEQVGEEVTGVLQRAYETAHQITTNAERDASEQRAAAARDAADAIARAEQRVRSLDLDTDRIWGERERILADARELAAQLTVLADAADARFPPASEASDAPAEPVAATIDEQLDVAFGAEQPAVGLL
jgi:hypothetical protein